MPDSMQICFKTILGRPEYGKVSFEGMLCPLRSPIFLKGANDCTAPYRRVPRSWQVRSLQVVAAWLCAEMLQWHRHRFPPKSTCEQKQPKQIHLLWYMQCICNVCYHHVPLTCFTAVSIRVPSGTKATYLQLLAKWLFSKPLLSPNLEDNSHLARWSLESKYMGCLPNMEVSRTSWMISSFLVLMRHPWADLKWSDIYLHELPKKGSVLSLAARLLFGGISDIARTPCASRPAVPLHLGMLERLAMTVTFLGCALPVYLTQTTSQGPHTSTASPTKNCGLGPQIPDNVKTNAEPHTSYHIILFYMVKSIFKKKTSWILTAPRKLGPTQPYQCDLAWKTEEKHLSHLRVKLHRWQCHRHWFHVFWHEVGFYGDVWHDIVTTNDGHLVLATDTNL